MNLMKRALSLVLVCLMLATLCACGGKAKVLAARQEELCTGKWLTSCPDSPEEARYLLENIDMYEEEIALADLNSLNYSVIFEFSPDGTYRQYLSVEHTKADIRAFYEGAFRALFENRSVLSGIYETPLDSMDEAEFQLFYAGLYGSEDFSALLNEFVDSAYDYKWEDLESGTYVLKNVNLLAVERVTSDPEAETSGTIPFTLKDGVLTLQYSDGDAVYTHID